MTKKKSDMVTISLYIRSKTDEKLTAYAEKENRRKSNAIEYLLDIAFKTLEEKGIEY